MQSLEYGKILFKNILQDVFIALDSLGFKEEYIVKGAVALSLANEKYNKGNSIIRYTVDLDLHWFNRDSLEQLASTITDELNNITKHEYVYTLTKRRGLEKNPNSDSLKFNVENKSKDEQIKFSIDINIGEILAKYDEYSAYKNYIGENIRTYTLAYMLADKLCVVTSPKIYRRIKDLIDVYRISTLKCFSYSELYENLREKRDINGLYLPDLKESIDLEKLDHAYNKLRRVINKPSLDTILNRVLTFIEPLLYKRDGIKYWDKESGQWV